MSLQHPTHKSLKEDWQFLYLQFSTNLLTSESRLLKVPLRLSKSQNLKLSTFHLTPFSTISIRRHAVKQRNPSQNDSSQKTVIISISHMAVYIKKLFSEFFKQFFPWIKMGYIERNEFPNGWGPMVSNPNNRLLLNSLISRTDYFQYILFPGGENCEKKNHHTWVNSGVFCLWRNTYHYTLLCISQLLLNCWGLQ